MNLILFLLISLNYYINHANSQQPLITLTKIVCTCDLAETENVVLACPRYSRIQMINAFTYDDVTHFVYNNCSSLGSTRNTVAIRDMVFFNCNRRRNCTIPQSSLKDIYLTAIYNLTCPSARFEWNCVSTLAESSDPESKSQSFDITYLLYIVLAFFLTMSVLAVSIVVVRRCNTRRALRANRRSRTLLSVWSTHNSNTERNSVDMNPPSYREANNNNHTTNDINNFLPSYSEAIHLKSVDNPFFKLDDIGTASTSPTSNNQRQETNQEVQIIVTSDRGVNNVIYKNDDNDEVEIT